MSLVPLVTFHLSLKSAAPKKSRVVFGGDFRRRASRKAWLSLNYCSTLVLLQGNLLLDIQTETSIQADLGFPERGLRHRGVAGRWIVAVDMKQTPFTNINWVSQKDPEVRGRGKALGFVPSVRYSIGVELRFLRFFFLD